MLYNMKKLIQLLVIIVLLGGASLVRAEEPIPYLDLITEIPATSLRGLDTAFSKKSVPWWVGIIGSTAVLYHNDEVILRDWQREGRNAGIGNQDNTRPILYIGDIDLLRLPTDTGSFVVKGIYINAVARF